MVSLISKFQKVKITFLPVLFQDKKLLTMSKQKIKHLKSKQKHISSYEVVKKRQIKRHIVGDELYLSEEHIKRFINIRQKEGI